MLQTAWATTATATSCNPCRTPSRIGPCILGASSAKANSANADGSVNPVQAASAPVHPARRSPTSRPTWLLAGPGSIWQRATKSAYSLADSHWRSLT